MKVRFPLLLAVGALTLVPLRTNAEVIEVEVCVFGGTSGGLAAGVQAARLGRTVVVAEPGNSVGGLTTGGLGATDIGNKAAIGGLAREFYQRIARHYAKDASWKLESRADYFALRKSGQSGASDLSGTNATMWTFEPHVAAAVFHDMLREARVPVYLEQRLVSVHKEGLRILSIRMENGNEYRARIFIDATYEGDLMAKAGVSYHVGREANATYGETLNGIRAETPKHQFIVPVDPYLKPGDPSSGLLPFIQPGDGGVPGAGDHRVQAYNYRLCFTTNAANRMALEPPPGYDPARYELLARYLEAWVASTNRPPKLSDFWNPIWMPNQKTDINNNGGFSTDFIGANYDYPEASYERRAQIAREHEYYIRGFLTFLATSPRVPPSVRAEMQQWGPAKDEFQATGGWPNQLYVREARRMVSDLVMTEHHCRGREKVADSVGLAAYNMDSHNCQRIVKNGRVENEGDVQVPPMSPYPISYRALVPKAAECENLLVPVCLAASHIAYGSIRMEPVFMILGQSAATAASLAIASGTSVQEVDYPTLRTRLLADGQILEWRPTAPGQARLSGIVVDDTEAEKEGDWTPSANVTSRQVGGGYVHDNNAGKGRLSLTYRPDLPAAGEYEVVLLSPPHPNRATNVLVTLAIAGREAAAFRVNQRDSSRAGATSLGRFRLPAGRQTALTVSNRDTTDYVVADGAQFIPVR
ncbi:MAG TPA: FAD-dependent oxidoreductase [Methylomirabilota bacterium]|nr:FAD-dependent oxidoreductase [Methylomirabilota bacterium]